jgi:hypothetical protein
VLSCLDFTERRPHLAGAVGAALHRHFLARAWVVPVGSGRALRVTDEGGPPCAITSASIRLTCD